MIAATALVHGNDFLLNETRRLVLERSGIPTAQTMEPEVVLECMTKRTIDVLILCHTVSVGERDRLLGLASELHPEMKTILLYNNFSPIAEDAFHRSVGTLDGPVKLTTTVQSLLSTTASQTNTLLGQIECAPPADGGSNLL